MIYIHAWYLCQADGRPNGDQKNDLLAHAQSVAGEAVKEGVGEVQEGLSSGQGMKEALQQGAVKAGQTLKEEAGGLMQAFTGSSQVTNPQHSGYQQRVISLTLDTHSQEPILASYDHCYLIGSHPPLRYINNYNSPTFIRITSYTLFFFVTFYSMHWPNHYRILPL